MGELSSGYCLRCGGHTTDDLEIVDDTAGELWIACLACGHQYKLSGATAEEVREEIAREIRA